MKIDFEKGNGLVPAIVQHALTKDVLMLGFMNKEAYEKSLKENKVCFYSRTKKRIWMKGETSGNFLNIKAIKVDCDNDTLLIKAIPMGKTCHTGMSTCFGDFDNKSFLYLLEDVIKQRQASPSKSSYTSKLFAEGIDRIVQKVGEETIELLIEAKNESKENIVNETADLLYHLLVLLRKKDIEFVEVEKKLSDRHQEK